MGSVVAGQLAFKRFWERIGVGLDVYEVKRWRLGNVLMDHGCLG